MNARLDHFRDFILPRDERTSFWPALAVGTRDSRAGLGVMLVVSLDPPLIGINYIKL